MEMYRNISIWVMLTALLLVGCTDHEVLTTYEVVKETYNPIPISFSPYVGTEQEVEATTRADLNYLIYYMRDFNISNNQFRYRNIPFLGEQRSGHTRIGHAAYNNYIVGVYGFWHDGSDWETDKDKTTLQADFMTNQPLLHLWKNNTDGPYWTYSPLKYWPNNNASGGTNGYSTETDKVTFISYYPFQDYSGGEYYKDGTGTSTTEPVATLKSNTATIPADGIQYWTFEDNAVYKTKNNINLTCITPPAKNATWKAAYTFGFQQKAETKDHLDFMLGINEDVTKQNIGNNVTLNLRHALCAVYVKVNFDGWARESNNVYVEEMPDNVKWTINSVTLAGVYDKGTVTPKTTANGTGFDWTLITEDELGNPISPVDYTIFTEDPRPIGNFNVSLKDDYTSDKPLSQKYKRTTGSGYLEKDNVYTTSNGAGLKWLILALPQKANENTYLKIDYDLEYTYNTGIEPLKVVYKNCKESYKLPTGTFDFPAGKRVVFNVYFYLKSVSMDATMADWDEEEYYNIEEGKGVVEE